MIVDFRNKRAYAISQHDIEVAHLIAGPVGIVVGENISQEQLDQLVAYGIALEVNYSQEYTNTHPL